MDDIFLINAWKKSSQVPPATSTLRVHYQFVFLDSNI